MYKVQTAKSVSKFIQSQSKKIQGQFINKLRSLADNPRPPGCKVIKGMADTYRIRSGDYRIIYTIRAKKLLVLVVRIRHRKDAYRNL